MYKLEYWQYVDLLHSVMRTTNLYYECEPQKQILDENNKLHMVINTLKCNDTTITLRNEYHDNKCNPIIKIESENREEKDEFKKLFEKFFLNVEV